jgi:hypothetical protein
MKKLFTLVALLACVLGAKAEWVEDYSLDYSTKSGFPFYVMGYVPEWLDGVMTDFGAMYAYKTEADVAEGDNVIGDVATDNGTVYKKIELAEPAWHQYFIADGIPTELDGAYTVKALVKASEACTINVNMGWGWGDGQQASASVAIPTDWTEVEWEYSGIGGTSCNLVAQPGTATATIEWKWVTVSHNQKETRPVTWQEWLTNDGQPIIPGVETESKWMGDAETAWDDAETKFNDQTKNHLICAWSKEKGRNMNENDGWDPFPADIEVDPKDPNNHVFVCHGQPATTEGDASAWDNQFWIESPKAWKAGDQVKIHFRYMASQDVSSTDTQIHHQNPSDYLIWHAIGNIAFTTEWQEFDGTMTIADDMAGGWSIAFNLNSVVKDAVDFYFDDLSWQSMVLDEGYFVAASNAAKGIEYDFDNAIEFVQDPDDESLIIATIGEVGKPDTWVNEAMISTVRGNDASYKSNTLKPSGNYVGEDNWGEYTAGSLAKIKLPAAGAWKISLDTEGKQINILKLDGEEDQPTVEIVPNPTEIVINALERDNTEAEQEGGTGQPWDNQFWIVANRELSTGEATVVQFKYKAAKAAKSSTQCHADPGAYLHWAAIGDVNFTEEWQDFEATLTVAGEANGMKSIAFNLAEIKDANDYYIKDVVWKTEDGTESLINMTGAENFWVKVGAGTAPYQYDPTAINGVVVNKNTGSAAIYNIAGQRVSKSYKGIVVKEGKKYLVK